MSEVKKTAFIFNANEVTEFNGDDVLPAGDYLLMVVDAEIAKTKNNEEYLKLVWQVADGAYAGKKVFHNLFIFNRNDIFRNKELGYFARICKVCGKDNLSDLTELYNIACRVVVTVKTKDDYTYNELKKFFPAGTADTTAPAEEDQYDDVPF